MAGTARSDVSVAAAIAALITIFSLSRQFLGDELGSLLGTLAAGATGFVVALYLVKWYRSAP